MKFETENIAVGEFVFIAVVEMCVAVAFSERVLFFLSENKTTSSGKTKKCVFPVADRP